MYTQSLVLAFAFDGRERKCSELVDACYLFSLREPCLCLESRVWNHI
jgi:hypothetical protein